MWARYSKPTRKIKEADWKTEVKYERKPEQGGDIG
jgi:hypothetical protein